MMKTLKDWIVAYRKDKSVMNEFITYETVREMNEQGQYDEVRYMRTKDKAMNRVMKRLEARYCQYKDNWIDKKDMNEYLLHAIVEVFENADIERSPEEIISWACGDEKKIGKMEFVLLDELRKRYDGDVKIISENETVKHEDKDDAVNISDFQVYRDWLKGEDVNTYEKFLEFVGGLESILSDAQFEVYTYMMSGKTQQEIAKLMGNVSQQYISKTWKSALERIRKEYLAFRTYRVMMKTNTYEKIKTFVKYTDNILKLVTDDEAMLFTYTVNFLKEYEDDDISIEFAHENKKDISTSVLDALFDYMKQKDLKWFMYIWKNIDEVKDSLNKKDKQRFVKVVIASYKEYLKQAKNVIDKASQRIVEREIHEKVIDLIS
jgi:hypothetical protein